MSKPRKRGFSKKHGCWIQKGITSPKFFNLKLVLKPIFHYHDWDMLIFYLMVNANIFSWIFLESKCIRIRGSCVYNNYMACWNRTHRELSFCKSTVSLLHLYCFFGSVCSVSFNSFFYCVFKALKASRPKGLSHKGNFQYVLSLKHYKQGGHVHESDCYRHPRLRQFRFRTLQCCGFCTSVKNQDGRIRILLQICRAHDIFFPWAEKAKELPDVEKCYSFYAINLGTFGKVEGDWTRSHGCFL